MKLKKNNILIALCLCVIVSSCSGSADTRKKDKLLPPPDTDRFYVGVGTADYYKDLETTESRARESALKRLAESISVTVGGESLQKVRETNNSIYEVFEQAIRTSINDTKLINVETYQRSIDPVTYDVTIVLVMSKSLYNEWFKKKSDQAKQMAVKYWTSGNRERGKRNANLAIAEYFRALHYLMQVDFDDHKFEYPPLSGNEIDVFDDIRRWIQDILQNIQIDIISEEGSLVAGTWEQQKISLRVIYQNRPLSNFPISVELGPLRSSYQSNSEGKVDIILTGQHLNPGLIKLKITPDFSGFEIEIKQSKTDEPDIDITKLFIIPQTEKELEVRPVRVLLRAKEESQFGVLPPEERFVSQTLKNILSRELRWEFVDYQYESDLILELNSNTFETQVDRTENGYLYTYRTNVQVSLRNSKSGEEILSWIQDPPSRSGGQNQRVAVQNSLRAARNDMETRFGIEIVNRFRENRLR